MCYSVLGPRSCVPWLTYSSEDCWSCRVTDTGRVVLALRDCDRNQDHASADGDSAAMPDSYGGSQFAAVLSWAENMAPLGRVTATR